MSLTADQLFTPAPSGVGLDPNTDAAAGTWLATMLATAQAIGLDTTSWQAGAPERTIMSIAAVAAAQSDVIASMMSQGGFLDFAASGTVTYTNLDGSQSSQPVSPDPSIPSQNPDGSPSWLDALGQSFFNVIRLQATYATGDIAIANTTVGAITYPAGNYHIANTNTGATYVNTSALSVPPSIIAGLGGTVTGVATGSTTVITTGAVHGLGVGDVVYISGVLGVTGLSTAIFAVVQAVPSLVTFRIGSTTSGTWTSGGSVYLATIANFIADVVGVVSNAGAGQISTTVTQNIGVFVSNTAALSASNYESNQRYAARCRLKLAALSPDGPASAYDYFALSAQSILAAQTPAVSLTNGSILIATTFSNPQTATVTTLVSSSSPASTVLGEAVTPGVAQLGITATTNATPIAVTTASNHGLSTGDAVIVSGVLGNTNANVGTTITVTGLNTFTLDGSVGNGAYEGGGHVSGGDLGQVDTIIQDNAVPDGITAITQSALAFPVAIVAVVVVPQAYVATYTAAAPAALQALFETFPIGGNIPPGGTSGTIPFSTISGTLVDAGSPLPNQVSYVRQVSSLTINGVSVDLDYPSPDYVAVLSTPAITVVGV